MICLITDRSRLSSGDDAADRLVGLVEAAAAAGVDVIQVRERDLDARPLTVLVERCVEAVRGTAARVVVNDRADVALAAGAHGVHLRSDSAAADRIRPLLAPDALVGRSVHTAERAAEACRVGGIDYLILGTLYATSSKDSSHRLTSVDELSAACRLSTVPVLAIGGITVETSRRVAAAGASGIAAIGMFIPPSGRGLEHHVRSVVAELRRTFDTCKAVP
jgi:thiamine-phosphate pyrophosphorylase